MACSIKQVMTSHCEEFSRAFSVKRIGLFGSFARREAVGSSDIDVVVELSKPDLFCLVGIKQTLADVFDRRVDVVRYRDDMNPSLRKRIDRDAIYV